MYKNILVLDDGTEISAGAVGKNAIISLTYTATVTTTTDLCPGAACSNKIELEIWVEPGENLRITSGTELAYYKQDESGARNLVGTFWAVKPTKQSRNTYKIYAYDAVSKLDGIQSTWLRENQDIFPISIWEFAQTVANRCGVEIENSSLPINGGHMVQAFYADNLTGRKLLSWVAEASGTFLRATPEGKIEFAWYTPAKEDVGAGSGSQRAIVRLASEVLRTSQSQIYTIGVVPKFYYQGSLSFEDYTCKAIDKVQIKQSDDDVGTIYPPDESGSNAWVISGNLLLTAQTSEELQSVAQALFGVLDGVTYVPCSFDTKDDGTIEVGNTVQVTDPRGNVFTTFIMTGTYHNGKVTFEGTGNASRDGTAAVNEQSYTNWQGKVLEISASVDGLKIVNRDLQGNLASLELTVEGIETNVQKQLDDMTDYVDQQTGEIKDQAVSEAVSSAMQQVNESLTFYPTKVEMNSAIEQSASEINLTVSQKLTGYSTTSQMQQYVNGQTSGILDEAKDYTDGQLELYPTTIEMNSAIEQSAASIRLSVNETLTMYPSNSQMQSYVNGQVGGILDDAKDYTDGQLQNYVTQVQMESAIEQSADNINLSVTQRLTSYSTTSQMQSYVQGQASDTLDDAKDYTDGQVATRPTTTTVQNMIDIGIEGITLSASTNGTTSTITLKSGSTTITSAQIKFTGLVTFTDLYTSGKTQINADNITTGTVGARILSSAQGASVNDICATEIDAGVIYTKVGSLAGAERTIFSLSPLYDSSNGNYYAQMQFKGDLSTWREMNLYMGEGNFNIVSPPNGPSGKRVGLVITVDDLTMWNDMILHGDLNVASILSRVPEWRYVDSIGTYVLCGPRTA